MYPIRTLEFMSKHYLLQFAYVWSFHIVVENTTFSQLTDELPL